MVSINPFCDADIRYGLRFLSGVNLLLLTISILVDALAILELAEYFETWDPTSFYLPVTAGFVLLVSDLVANVLLVFTGWMLYTSLSQKIYPKIHKLFCPSLILVGAELVIVLVYLACIPSSPFFYFFSAFEFTFKAYFFWPLKRFIDNFSSQPRQRRRGVTERTRLLASVA